MALYSGTKEQLYDRVYLSIRHGVLLQENGAERNDVFTSVDGKLVHIFSKNYESQHSKVRRWYIELQDRHVVYSISFPYYSPIFTSIILSLANADLDRQSHIRIEPYQYDSSTSVRTFCNEKELDLFCYRIPAVREITRGKVQTEDTSERMRFIETVVSDINKRLLQ